MTQDEIIEMAREAGASPDGKIWLMYAEELEVFYKLAVAKEREDIIKVIERLGTWAHIHEIVSEIKGDQA